LLAAAGHARAGAEELAAALELGPPDPRTALESARAFETAGDAAAAIAILERTLVRVPGEARLAAALVQLEATRQASGGAS
jgi:predicted TPR repeat methyltransferase